MKHIDIRLRFVKRAQESGVIHARYVNSQDQIAEIFTKPLLLGEVHQAVDIKRKFARIFCDRRMYFQRIHRDAFRKLSLVLHTFCNVQPAHLNENHLALMLLFLL